MNSQQPFILQTSGWLSGAIHVPSPNYNQRPANTEISLLVVHNISLPPGQFGNGCIKQFFCNQLDHQAHPYFREIEGMEVSSHFLIERDGTLVQFVPVSERAWHAGRSVFQGIIECNDYSVGIELEGSDEQPYTDTQYAQLIELTRCLMRAHPGITQDRIVGHSDIAPGRKTDPGPHFDWKRYKNTLTSGIS